jgi:putative Ca2+/H+ antiporter (TMEM165/GDT1 family)
MDAWKIFTSTFVFIFVAELGDKTQLATLLLSADKPGARWIVFAGSAAALVLAAAIGVAAGSWVSHYVSEKALKFVAGLGFILMGLWTLRETLPA